MLALAAVAALPAAALAAPARGFTFERGIFADAADVALRSPEGVACDDRGAVIVADTGNARLLTYTWREGSLDGGAQVKLTQLPYPVRLQIDSKGFLYVLDRKARRIGKVDAKGAFAGYVEPKGASGNVTVVAFKLDAADNVYLLDVSGARVLVLAPDGKLAREVPLPTGVQAVTDVAAETGGKIFIVDAPSATLYVAEPQDKAFKPLTASMKSVLGFPGYLVADNRGKLWVVDQNGGAVVRLGNDGSFQGRELALGWADGALQYPGQVCVTAGGEVFVADRNNNRVQIFAMPR
jgi:sugar lactone lactonase YvrE